MKEFVILVDELDQETGIMEKMEAHQKGELHRAFSVLVYNSKGEMLLQKRSRAKYHSGGLWTNACCSHPVPGETITSAASRRLREEMGIHTETLFTYKFIYKAQLQNGLVEHELDHVLLALFDGTPSVNLAEVEDWKFVSVSWLRADIEQNPGDYTQWFRLIISHSVKLIYSGLHVRNS